MPGTAPPNRPPQTVPPPPVIDASAPAFMRDDSAMANLAPDVLDKLRAGGGACTTQVIYPYEGTMFPGALAAPLIMWDGAADAAYVHVRYDQNDKVDYRFARGASDPGELQIPRDAWNEITRRTNGAELIITLSVSTGGNVSTCQLKWRVAAGNMVGALYYNTYQAPPPGELGMGAVMRLRLGGEAEIYKQAGGGIPPLGPCVSCHSVSFNGSTMVASYHDYGLAKQYRVERFDITQDVQPQATNTVENANFGALTPDGSRILAMGNPECTGGSDTFPRKPNNFPLVEGPDHARMLDTKTGQDTNATGLEPDHYMWMPQFSPNGDKIVFNDAKPDGTGTNRTDLAVMDYDAASNSFSNRRVVLSTATMPGVARPTLAYAPAPAFGGLVPCGVDMCMDPANPPPDCSTSIPGLPGDVGALPTGACDGPCYPAWPFFTPDGRAVIFSLTSEPDFTQAFPGRDVPAKSELWYVDLETMEAVKLDNANKGRAPIDTLNNYYPTVMPVAVGGYFWVFWSAVRAYGHKVDGRVEGAIPNATLDADKKRIWAAAIKPKLAMTGEITANPGPLKDPSLPGFYVDGQSESGNVRAFAALNPCLAVGETCESGLDCCCGYCLVADGQSEGKCGCEVPMCAKINEKCTTAAECCPPDGDGPKLHCIAGFCGFLVVQ
jgi:hypothetical protein